MFKSAMYLDVFMVMTMSIICLIITCITKKEKNLKDMRFMAIIFKIINVALLFLSCYSNLIEVDWDFLFLIPEALLTVLLTLIILIVTDKKLDKYFKETKNIFNISLNAIVPIAIPIIIFIIPLIYELIIINNCEIMLNYNYQNGIIISENTHIAITDNRAVNTTLNQNMSFRTKEEMSYREADTYEVTYENNIMIKKRDSHYDYKEVQDERIRKIAEDVKTRYPLATELNITSFKDGKYNIVYIEKQVEGKDYTTHLETVFYKNAKYVQKIETHGNLDSVIYYK